MGVVREVDECVVDCTRFIQEHEEEYLSGCDNCVFYCAIFELLFDSLDASCKWNFLALPLSCSLL